MPLYKTLFRAWNSVFLKQEERNLTRMPATLSLVTKPVSTKQQTKGKTEGGDFKQSVS
jgi:hypothetical protein